MNQFGVVLKSMPNKKAGILVLLDDLDDAVEIAAELTAKGIEVNVMRMVKQTGPTFEEGKRAVATGDPIPA